MKSDKKKLSEMTEQEKEEMMREFWAWLQSYLYNGWFASTTNEKAVSYSVEDKGAK